MAVTGVPDERAGELPRAYVIRKNRKVQETDIVKWAVETANLVVNFIFPGSWLLTLLLTRGLQES